MLETVEGIYENGQIRFFEDPGIHKGKVLVTFLEDEPQQDSDSKVIDWDYISTFDGHAGKWKGLLRGLDLDLKKIREQRLSEKCGSV